MSIPRKSNATKWRIILAVLTVLAAAAGVGYVRSRLAQDAGSPPMVHPLATQVKPDQVRVASDSTTSVKFALTLIGNEVQETITIQPGNRYRPTAEESAQAARSGRQTFAARLTARPEADGGLFVLLQYFVPIEAFPPDFRQELFAQPAAARYSGLIRAARADDGDGLGAAMSMGTKFSKGYHQIESAFAKSEDHDQWMKRFDALEECARHPTSTVTQNAYRQDPQSQQNALDAIADARSEVWQASALRFVNQETSVATGLVTGPLKNVTKWGKSVSDWNDSSLKNVANQRLNDISKLVDCDLAPPPVAIHDDGTIEYHMHREGYLDFAEEDRLVKGTISLSPGPASGIVVVSGDGEFKGRANSPKFQTKATCQGTSEIRGSGANSRLWIGASPNGGTCQFTERGKSSPRSYVDSDTDFRCDFDNVDLVNGGSYSVHAGGEESDWAVCSLELKPQRK